MAELPTEEEIAALSRASVVAYATRCARRVLPLFSAPEVGQGGMLGLAIEGLEQPALGVGTEPSVAFQISKSTDDAVGAYVADSVGNALRSLEETRAGRIDRAVVSAFEASWSAAKAAGYGDDSMKFAQGESFFDDVFAASRADFEKLVRACAGENWDDQTPVPPEFFGPIWPDGEPEGWGEAVERAQSTEASETTELPKLESKIGFEMSANLVSSHEPLTIVLDPGSAPAEEITEFYLALDALYRSHGGSGLKLLKDGSIEIERSKVRT